MKKQPENKITKKVGEINTLCKENSDTVATIQHIMLKFDISGKLKGLNNVKQRGFKIVELLVILMIIPFYRIRIDNMDKKNRGQKNNPAKKDAYYNLKNNEMIDWRFVLKAIVKQFRVLSTNDSNSSNTKTKVFIADDTTAAKTGLKIEYLSKVHDHTINGFLFGFKILVLGWFDGISFIPVDFSIHREKGQGSGRERKQMNKAEKKLKEITEQYNTKKQELNDKSKENKALKKQQKQSGKISKTQLDQIQRQIERMEIKLKKLKKQLNIREKTFKEAKAAYNTSLKQHPLCGLKIKQRQEQFKKERIKNSPGYLRAKEVDSKKTDNVLKMLGNAVKMGLPAQYFIADSWFFCSKLVNGVRKLSKELHYMGMVPMRETISYNYNGKVVNSNILYKENQHKIHRCRKYHSKYIQITVAFDKQPIQLFFVKMGRTKKWKLLATTNLALDFIKLFELYQIRWSIEVFFRETKQFLGLGKCQSRDFDAQISSTTLTMMQYITLCYYKRIHFQQKLDGIFEEISYQTIEASIVEKLIANFMELLDIVAQIVGIEPIELYLLLMHNVKATKIIKELKLESFMELKKVA